MKYAQVLFLLFCVLISQNIAETQEYEVSVTTVNVWVRAVDTRGNPVSGLNKNEFQIFEDNKKVSSTCFEEVNLSVPESQEVSQTTQNQIESSRGAASKRFVIFLDLYNTTQVEFERLRGQMDEFIGDISKRNWKVMLVAYLPTGKLGVVSPFTQDMGRIRGLLAQAKGNAQRDQRIKRNEDEIVELLASLNIRKDSDSADSSENLGSGGSSGLDSTQASHASIVGVEEQMFRIAVNNAYRQASHYAKQEKQSSEHAFGALESFSEYYASKLSEGDHTVVMFISGGINADPGRRYFELVNNFVTARAANVNPSDFALSFTGSTKENNFDLQQQIQKSVGKLNRFNMTLYAINTRGLDSSGTDITQMDSDFATLDTNTIKDYQDSLSQIAEETGGFSFQNSQNFKLGLENIWKDISHQYLLCYKSPDHKQSGDYHSIKVVLSRPGIKLRYRKGYVD